MQLQLQKHFKQFISGNPKLLKKYVSTGITALNYLIVPISGFAKHLLDIQDLDPNTVPGQKDLLALQNAFDRFHEEEYDSEYDLSWVQKKLDKVRESSRWGNITQETFVELTDLNQLPTDHGYGLPLTIGQTGANTVAADLINQIASDCDKKDIPLDTKEGRQAYRARVISELQERDNLKEALGELVEKTAAKNLPDAINELAAAAKKFGILVQEKPEQSEKKNGKKAGVKISKKRLNKNNGSFKEPATRMSKKITRAKFTGNFTKTR
jgi:hypothetical protein